MRAQPFAPRLSPRLLDIVERLAPASLGYAEINRLVGAEAERMGLPRPSYQRVRLLVHEARDLRRTPSLLSVAADVAVRRRPPEALLRRTAEGPRPHLRDLHGK